MQFVLDVFWQVQGLETIIAIVVFVKGRNVQLQVLTEEEEAMERYKVIIEAMQAGELDTGNSFGLTMLCGVGGTL